MFQFAAGFHRSGIRNGTLETSESHLQHIVCIWGCALAIQFGTRLQDSPVLYLRPALGSDTALHHGVQSCECQQDFTVYPGSSMKILQPSQQCKTEKQLNRRVSAVLEPVTWWLLCCRWNVAQQIHAQISSSDCNLICSTSNFNMIGTHFIQDFKGWLLIKWLLCLLQTWSNFKTVYIKVILLSYLSEESFPEKLSIAKLQAPICNII